jgi:hypothetical protein
MALIREFTEVQKGSNRVHDVVDCGWTVFERDGAVYVQLDTYGTDHRQIPGKVSQSLQLDEASARALMRILRHAFPTSVGLGN